MLWFTSINKLYFIAKHFGSASTQMLLQMKDSDDDNYSWAMNAA
jgi:hypothetical protein